MSVLFISLAVSLDTQKNGADTNGKTAGMELLFFWNIVHFGTYFLMQESLVHNI